MRKISKVRKKIMVLGIAALFSIATCGGVAFGATEYYFSFGPSPGRADDSARVKKENNRDSAYVTVHQYIEQTNGNYLYVRVRLGGNKGTGPCTEKKAVASTATYTLPYYCIDMDDMYYLRCMTDDIATTGYAAMTGKWTP